MLGTERHHDSGSDESRALCDAFLQATLARDSRVSRKEGPSGSCPLTRAGVGNFAYVVHRGEHILVQCVGDPERLSAAARQAGLSWSARATPETGFGAGTVKVTDLDSARRLAGLLVVDGSDEAVPSLPEEVAAGLGLEGAAVQILVNRYERDARARSACLAAHGARCNVCELDFEARYGPLGHGFIHVHHLIPLASIGTEYAVDGPRDLVPVCPNCHAMLHREDPPLTPAKLREVIASTRPAE